MVHTENFPPRMTRARRSSAATVRTGVIVGSFTLLMISACRETIVHSVEEVTANRIALVLAQAAIESEKVQEGNLWNVVVSDEKATEALATIEEQRLLKPSLSLAASTAGNFMQSREERIRGIERERASTLEETLERLPGVKEARVHLILAPEEALEFVPKRKRDSASVLIISGINESVEEEQVKRLVSGGVGIEVSAISVVITKQPRQSPLAQIPHNSKLQVSRLTPNRSERASSLYPRLLVGAGLGSVLCIGLLLVSVYRRSPYVVLPNSSSTDSAVVIAPEKDAQPEEVF